MSETKIAPLAQMTIKAVGADPKEAIKQGKQVFMTRIFGEATSAKTKEDRKGDAYTYLIGMFRAERPAKTDAEKADAEDGVMRYEAEKLFLPGSLQEKIESQLSSGGGRPVQFGYDIYSTPDNNVSVGYRYAAAAVVETATADRLQAMAGELVGKPLPGTTAASKPKPESKPEPESKKKK